MVALMTISRVALIVSALFLGTFLFMTFSFVSMRVLGYWFAGSSPDSSAISESAGWIGDSFGAINAFVSGLGLLLIGWSLLQTQNSIAQNTKLIEQAQESIEVQRQELEESRMEFVVSRISNVIYLQLGLLDTKCKALRLREQKGIQLIRNFNQMQRAFSEQGITFKDLDETKSWLANNSDSHELIRSLKNSLELFLSQIGQKDEKGMALLSTEAQTHLYQQITANLNHPVFVPFLESIKEELPIVGRPVAEDCLAAIRTIISRSSSA